ncbi:AAA family ATPase [Sedimenticola hydrogenitrophicus]|uniref:nucleotide-binding protein n=1 Tax=Sedimenticola hydrogenitrophicus TaxID=2967975 RepID=UPI0021A293A8|nr:AAA family ATPase [Sedimenticola hydrogenitrophicus]
MHNIMVLNAKGGCGKTTISTTLACYFAGQGYKTALMDYDPQNSSHHWLDMRKPSQPQIRSIDAARPRSGMTRTWQLHSGVETEVVVIDTPAGVTGGRLVDLFNKADSILIPVMPTVIDLQAVEGFLTELMHFAKNRLHGKRVAMVINRVRFKTATYEKIEALSARLGIPLIGSLRDTHNYAIAMETGMGICEMKNGVTSKDRKQWQPIINWLHEAIPGKEPVQPSSFGESPGWQPEAKSVALS